MKSTLTNSLEQLATAIEVPFLTQGSFSFLINRSQKGVKKKVRRQCADIKTPLR
ncbi:hypothetical protein HY772_05525 [Candidatus Woesearchaeota archaeon]|nr:hypothetical protein [Candidatus Woesearchaeota archaeon]